MSISHDGHSFTVHVTSEGETPDIYAVRSSEDDAKCLAFALHWSTGRFNRYQVRLRGDAKLHLTYTYTQTSVWHRSARLRNVADPSAIEPLIGTWIDADEWEAGIEFEIGRSDDTFAVSIVDRSDGRDPIHPTVTKTKLDDDTRRLTFTAIWPRGPRRHYQVWASSVTQINVVMTNTDTETWHRQSG